MSHMREDAEQLAAAIRWELGVRGGDPDPVLAVRELVERLARLEAFATAVREAVEGMGYVPEITALLDEHAISELLPAPGPPPAIDRGLVFVPPVDGTIELQPPRSPPRITLTRNGQQIADLGPGDEFQAGNTIWSYGPTGLTSRRVGDATE